MIFLSMTARVTRVSNQGREPERWGAVWNLRGAHWPTFEAFIFCRSMKMERRWERSAVELLAYPTVQRLQRNCDKSSDLIV